MSKGIIPGTAEDRATFPVVMLITHKTVGILEIRAATAVQVLGPLFPNGQVPLGSQAANEALRILCKGQIQNNRLIKWENKVAFATYRDSRTGVMMTIADM